MKYRLKSDPSVVVEQLSFVPPGSPGKVSWESFEFNGRRAEMPTQIFHIAFEPVPAAAPGKEHQWKKDREIATLQAEVIPLRFENRQLSEKVRLQELELRSLRVFAEGFGNTAYGLKKTAVGWRGDPVWIASTGSFTRDEEEAERFRMVVSEALLACYHQGSPECGS